MPQQPSRWTNRLSRVSCASATNRLRSLDPLAGLKAEQPDADGIRRGLVARVQQLIAEGEYDTTDRWSAAEERLLNRIAE